jgi:hypothetical protein
MNKMGSCAERNSPFCFPVHLDAYIHEQVFRFNNRATKDNKLTDTDRFVGLMAQVAGKRLTFAQLTGKDEPHQPKGPGKRNRSSPWSCQQVSPSAVSSERQLPLAFEGLPLQVS